MSARTKLPLPGALCVLLIGCTQPPAATTGAAVSGPSPGSPLSRGERGPSGPPDLAPPNVHALLGVWGVLQSPKTTPVPPKGAIPLTARYEARRAELQKMDEAGVAIPGRNAKCIASGLPDMMTFGFRLEGNAEYLTMIGGTGPTIRLIWLNRKQHTPDNELFGTYGGESLGQWDGDTLVVDTVGLEKTNEITYALPVNDEHMHIVERLRLRKSDELEVVTTIESKLALTKPYTYTYVYGRNNTFGEIGYCDRPSVNSDYDLTPPEGGYVPPGADK